MKRLLDQHDYNGQERRHSKGRRNGDANRILWWLLTTIAGMTILLAAGWATSLNNKVERNTEKLSGLVKIEQIAYDLGKRLDRIEKKQDYIVRKLSE